jgi:hypothetical protein
LRWPRQQTYGIFGAIQTVASVSTLTPATLPSASASRLLDRCFAGFALSGCVDRSLSRKAFVFTSQFQDTSQPYCLQCCTHPVPTSGADELWDLACPLNAAQRLSVSRADRAFRFARRESLEDDAVVECAMPARNASTYLSGYSLELVVIERSASMGTKFWRQVVNCSVTGITETADPPTTFVEYIRVRSVPEPDDEADSSAYAWVAPTVATVVAVVALVMAVPVYRGKIRGQRCTHCGTWIVFSARQHCIGCAILGCGLGDAASVTKVHVTSE